MFRRLPGIFLLFMLASSVSGALSAQENLIAKLKTSLVAPWLVAIQGDERNRLLRIKDISPGAGDTFLLEADYGYIEENQTPLQAEVTQTNPTIKLMLTTQAASKLAVWQMPDETFAGSFTTAKGKTTDVKFVKLSDEEVKGKAAAAKAAREAKIIVKPGPDVPADCSAFSGRWTGDWPFYGPKWLWVVEVGANCVAKCANWTTSAVPNKFQSCDIKNKVLVYQKTDGAEYYELRGDELWARYVYSGGQNTTVYRKLKPGEK